MRTLTIALMLALGVSLLAACADTETPGPQPDDVIATAAPAHPVRVQIPVLQVDTAVRDLGLQPNGEMAVPPDASDAGWYTKSPIPGQVGRSIISAHVNWKGVDGPFARLHELKAGDDVIVEGKDGAALTFVITRVETYPKDAFPTKTVYGDTDGPELALITCGGEFDPAAHSYKDNVIAFAQLDA